MRRKVVRWGIALAVIAALVASAGTLRRLVPSAKAQAPQFVTATVGRGVVDQVVTASGTVQAASSLDVALGTGGTVATVPVAVGSQVKAGQVLATLQDTSGLASAVSAARSSLAQAQLQLQQQENPAAFVTAGQLTQGQQLLQNAQANLQQKQASLQQAQANLQQQQQALAQAQQALVVTSPAAGLVEYIPATVGQSVSAGQTLMVVVPPGSPVQILAQAPQQSNFALQVGDAASAQVSATNQIYSGKVTAVGNGTPSSNATATQSAGKGSTPTPTVGTVGVTITLDDPSADLRDGMTALVNIYGGVNQMVSQTIQATGTVQYANDWNVAPSGSGTLSQLLVSPGQNVTLGQAVADISGTDLQQAIDKAKQAVQQAQLQVQQAQQQVDQGQQAVQQAQDNLKQVQSPPAANPQSITAQQAAVVAAQASLADKERQLAQLTVTAPMGGTVTAVNVQPGQTVSAGLAAFTIQTLGQLEVVAPVDEIDIAKIQVGQQAVITLDALPGKQYQGKVAQVAPTGTASNGVSTYNVTISLPAAPELKPGMSATVTIQVVSRQNVLRVPSEAVQGAGTSGVVRVLVNGAPQARRVGIGVVGSTWTEITSGLNAGDTIVVAQAQASTNPNAGRGGLGGIGGPGGGFGGGGGPRPAGGGRPGGGG